VVPVYDLGRDANGVPYFTMQRVQGLTLSDILDRVCAGDEATCARFPRRRILTVFVQVCLAIDYAHSRGVLHRDLKPSNVMVGEFGDVRVLDWGLAQIGHDSCPSRDLCEAIARATRGGSVFGTPGYMSPEQAHGWPLDRRSDVYSLGSMLFELLTFALLHDGTPGERIARTLQGGDCSPSLRVPEAKVPPELDAIVVKATALDPAQRYESARALAEAVDLYLDGDRDLERRCGLARSHVERAARLIDRLDSLQPLELEAAMSDLSCALAHEPGNARALELLRKLLSHAPRTLPREVEQARATADRKGRAELARTLMARVATWVAFIPLAWAMKPLNVPFAIAVASAVLATFLLAAHLGRHSEVSSRGICALLGLTGLSVLGLELVFGPFVLVPCLASTTSILFAGQVPAKARSVVILIGLLAVLGPFALEELGVLPPSCEFTEHGLRILPRLVQLAPGATRWLLVLATLASLVTPCLLAGRLRDRLAKAEKQLFLNAWHMERLGRTVARQTTAARPVG
jgi:serine/threonine-protein kinase